MGYKIRYLKSFEAVIFWTLGPICLSFQQVQRRIPRESDESNSELMVDEMVLAAWEYLFFLFSAYEY